MKGQSLDVLPLQPSSAEYTNTAEIFMKSLNRPYAKIVKVSSDLFLFRLGGVCVYVCVCVDHLMRTNPTVHGSSAS